jgi:hypothetical protein
MTARVLSKKNRAPEDDLTCCSHREAIQSHLEHAREAAFPSGRFDFGTQLCPPFISTHVIDGIC